MYTAGVLTVSDSASKGRRNDESGPIIRRLLKGRNYNVLVHEIVPDEKREVRDVLIKWVDEFSLDIILTTGGTGVSPRDITPEAARLVIDKEIPGIVEAVRIGCLDFTPMTMLSRGVAGVRGETLIINLPGRPKAVAQGMHIILPVLKHAVDKIRGDPTPCHQVT